jgi:REP element-mobilizing transposase RayT
MTNSADNRHLVSGMHSRGKLPHLKREGGTYFVTFRQAGTLPKELILRLKRERDAMIEQAKAAKRLLTWHEQEELFRWYANRVDKHLDAGHGVCHLSDPELAGLVVKAIQHFEGHRYELRAWVVMPNHVHAVVWPIPGQALSNILHSWKSYTAHEINRRLTTKLVPFWQRESYDHLIQNEVDLHQCCHYALMNPVKACLCAQPQDWPWSSGFARRRSSDASSGAVPVLRRVPTGGGTPLALAGVDTCAT